jgi:hypothetical protein
MIMIFRDEQVAKKENKKKEPNPGTETANLVEVFIQGLGIL